MDIVCPKCQHRRDEHRAGRAWLVCWEPKCDCAIRYERWPGLLERQR